MKQVEDDEALACLEQKAVKAANSCQWESAIVCNLEILKLKPANTGALNRLGRAYWENGQLDLSKDAFRQTLTIDPYNTIAAKNLERLKLLKEAPPVSGKPAVVNHAVFLEEPGKTKIVRLIRLASCHVLSGLDCADEVFLLPRSRFINVVSQKGTYLGCLPEDLSLRLVKLIKGGNRYQAFIRLIDSRNLQLFVRETKRSVRLRNIPSFAFLGFVLTGPCRAFS